MIFVSSAELTVLFTKKKEKRERKHTHTRKTRMTMYVYNTGLNIYMVTQRKKIDKEREIERDVL